jgi:hypothetical protein
MDFAIIRSAEDGPLEGCLGRLLDLVRCWQRLCLLQALAIAEQTGVMNHGNWNCGQ